MISKHSAHLTPLPFGIRTWLWRYTYLLLLISMLWHRQAIFESKGDKLSSSAESRIRTQGSLKPNLQQTECLLTNRLSYRGSSLKTWTRQPVPMISKHSAHLTPLPFGIRTWLWRYTYMNSTARHAYMHTYIHTHTYTHTYIHICCLSLILRHVTNCLPLVRAEFRPG